MRRSNEQQVINYCVLLWCFLSFLDELIQIGTVHTDMAEDSQWSEGLISAVSSSNNHFQLVCLLKLLSLSKISLSISAQCVGYEYGLC